MTLGYPWILKKNSLLPTSTSFWHPRVRDTRIVGSVACEASSTKTRLNLNPSSSADPALMQVVHKTLELSRILLANFLSILLRSFLSATSWRYLASSVRGSSSLATFHPELLKRTIFSCLTPCSKSFFRRLSTPSFVSATRRTGSSLSSSQRRTISAQVTVFPEPGGPCMRVVAADSLQVASRTAAFWLSFPKCQGTNEVLDCRDLSSSDLNTFAKPEAA